MVKVNFTILMEIFILVILKMIKLMEEGSIHIRMDLNMKVNGSMIYNTDKELKLGLTVQCFKEPTMKVENTDKVFIFDLRKILMV